MKIVVTGCAGGELDKIYDAVRRVQDKDGIAIDLVICCGNFQAVRDKDDLETLNVPPKFRKMGDFHKYYKGQKKAPVTTIFIGGRNEVPGYLRELYYGGWVAPNIYYIGYAGVVRVGPLRIAGLSGVFRPSDYFTGHYECPPYNETTRRSSCNVREWDVTRLERLTEPVDIVISSDWPRGIWKYGNCAAMLDQKDHGGDLRREMDGNSLGNLAAMDLLKKLRPGFWFSAHLNVKFPALVPHEDGTFTRFLALDKCWSSANTDFLQVLDIEPRSPSFLQCPKPKGRGWRFAKKTRDDATARLDYDPEWLAIQKVNHGNILFTSKNQKATVASPSKEEISWVVSRLREKAKPVPCVRAASRRHPNLLPTKLREASDTTSLRDLSTSKLRELFESRRMEFPGHLDKASLIRQLEEHDEFFAAERDVQETAADEAFPMLINFKADRGNPAQQRAELLEILELDDVWKKQEEEQRQLAILRGEISAGKGPENGPIDVDGDGVVDAAPTSEAEGLEGPEPSASEPDSAEGECLGSAVEAMDESTAEPGSAEPGLAESGADVSLSPAQGSTEGPTAEPESVGHESGTDMSMSSAQGNTEGSPATAELGSVEEDVLMSPAEASTEVAPTDQCVGTEGEQELPDDIQEPPHESEEAEAEMALAALASSISADDTVAQAHDVTGGVGMDDDMAAEDPSAATASTGEAPSADAAPITELPYDTGNDVAAAEEATDEMGSAAAEAPLQELPCVPSAANNVAATADEMAEVAVEVPPSELPFEPSTASNAAAAEEAADIMAEVAVEVSLAELPCEPNTASNAAAAEEAADGIAEVVVEVPLAGLTCEPSLASNVALAEEVTDEIAEVAAEVPLADMPCEPSTASNVTVAEEVTDEMAEVTVEAPLADLPCEPSHASNATVAEEATDEMAEVTAEAALAELPCEPSTASNAVAAQEAPDETAKVAAEAPFAELPCEPSTASNVAAAEEAADETAKVAAEALLAALPCEPITASNVAAAEEAADEIIEVAAEASLAELPCEPSTQAAADEAADEMANVAAEIEAAEAFLQEISEVLADPGAEASPDEDECASDVAVADIVSTAAELDEEADCATLCSALADAFALEDEDEDLEEDDEEEEEEEEEEQAADVDVEPSAKIRRIS